MTTSPQPMMRDGMYAMCVRQGLETCVLGGPYSDIDDVLDECFGEMMRCDASAESMFYVEVEGSRITVNAFPNGAFPLEEEVTATGD